MQRFPTSVGEELAEKCLQMDSLSLFAANSFFFFFSFSIHRIQNWTSDIVTKKSNKGQTL